MNGFLVPLDTVAAEVNARFRKAAEIESKANDHRIAAGKLLIEARDRVQRGEAGSVTWEKWCAEHIDRSQGDVRKVMRIAGAKDPVAARETEKKRTREHVASHRDRAYVSAVSQQEIVIQEQPTDALAAAIAAVRRLDPYDLADFKIWFTTNFP